MTQERCQVAEHKLTHAETGKLQVTWFQTGSLGFKPYSWMSAFAKFHVQRNNLTPALAIQYTSTSRPIQVAENRGNFESEAGYFSPKQYSHSWRDPLLESATRAKIRLPQNA